MGETWDGWGTFQKPGLIRNSEQAVHLTPDILHAEIFFGGYAFD